MPYANSLKCVTNDYKYLMLMTEIEICVKQIKKKKLCLTDF